MRYFFLSLLCIFLISCECHSSDLPEKECYKLVKLRKDIYMRDMKNVETCRLQENFCTLTSEKKTENGMNYTYTRQIPCFQFKIYKVVKKCILEYRGISPKSKRYTLTKECIHLKKKLIKK